MNNYTITFVSLRAGTVYTLSIGGGTGTPIPLKGAAQPFITQEDDTDDMFTPVRTQSGYIRIVDDGKDANGNSFDWRDLMPKTGTERPVTLSHDDGGNTVIDWVGYMQPQNFGGTLYGGTQEREFPVYCQMAALEGFNVDQSVDIVNVGYLLYSLLDNIGADKWRYVYFQGSDAVDSWLLKKATMMNYATEGSGENTYSSLQAIQDICAFFGWTLRTHGNDLWFTAADDAVINWQFERIQFSDLADIDHAQPVNVSWQTFGMTDFVNTDNEESYAIGIRKVTVKADINSHNNILEIPMSEIEPLFDGKPVSQVSQGDKTTFTVQYYPTEYENNLLSIDCYWDQEYIMGRFTAFEVYEGDVSQKHNYNFTYALVCNGRNVPFSEYCFMLASKFPISFDNGMLTVNGEVDMIGDLNDGSGNGYIYCALKVGDMWWDGSAWGYQEATFQIPIVNNKIQDNRQLAGPYIAYTGFGIPISDMGGLVEFRCLGSHSNGTTEGEACRFRSLTFGFARLASLASNNTATENTYTATNNSKFEDEKNIDLVWASDNGNAQGYGILMNPSGSYLTQLPYTASVGGQNDRPEQHLADRIAGFYGENKPGLSVNLDTDSIGDVTPGCMSGIYYPIAISHDWWNDITILRLLEMPSS